MISHAYNIERQSRKVLFVQIIILMRFNEIYCAIILNYVLLVVKK
jgi:hypothetical protein